MTVIEPPAGRPPSMRLRILLLGACATTGFAVGAIGWWLCADARWMLAQPAMIALGWLFVADPDRCRSNVSRGAP